jgi:hypothetical protein
VLAKHTKYLSFVEVLSIGIDRIQRNFETTRKQVDARKGRRILGGGFAKSGADGGIATL